MAVGRGPIFALEDEACCKTALGRLDAARVASAYAFEKLGEGGERRAAAIRIGSHLQK